MDSAEYLALASIVALVVVNVAGHVARAWERSRDANTARTNQAFAISGPLAAFLDDANPWNVVAWGLTPETLNPRLGDLWTHWITLRESVYEVGFGHHDAGVRDLSARVREAVEASLRLTTIYATGLVAKTDQRSDSDDARTAYAELRAAFDAWIARLR